MKRLLIIVVAGWMIVSASALAQQTSIMTSKHNLSAAGPGAIRASSEQEVCIFCHTPHNAAPIQPLWNRHMPVNAYTVYSSNSLDAHPGQPTGSSKLCLSCHDGTIAVGSVLSRSQPIQMVGGITTLPPGASNLGTDLSDDHPISFPYDGALATLDPKLKHPTLLPQQIKLDRNSEMQCTSCHDAHNDQFGKFLVMSNINSQLCNSCHQVGQTSVATHGECASCHKQHTAPSGPYLLTSKTVSETCVSCHGGTDTRQGANIAVVMNAMSKHDTNSPVNLKDHLPNNIVCSDCHEAHTMQTGTAMAAPNISPRLGNIAGVNSAGAETPRAQFEYEVCFKCHGAAGATLGGQSTISRQIAQTNTILEFAPAAVSSHPVEQPGKNSDVPSLRTGLTTASMIYCSDCHSSDTSPAGGAEGAGAAGPHGSNFKPLLAAPYTTLDGSTESAEAYALCYKCHDRNSILANQSFTAHSLHIVNAQTPCSVCHDAHGISSAQGSATNHSHLINFDISVVQRDPVTGLLEYRATGNRTGACYLSCHGVAHSPKTYPGGGAVSAPAAAMKRVLR